MSKKTQKNIKSKHPVVKFRFQDKERELELYSEFNTKGFDN